MAETTTTTALTTPTPTPTPAAGAVPARAADLHRDYGRGANAVRALRGVSVAFAPGTFTAVMGPSGSGKTTLLHCLAGLDRPTRGSVHWGDTEISRLPERRLAPLRRRRIGFVFQTFNLMPGMTVAQNVELPLRLAGSRPGSGAVRTALAEVGLAGRERRRPAELSGGQQQRVAIARALVARPDVLFADEPTGALDRATGHDVLALLRAGVDRDGQTCVMVTHDPVAAGYADRVLLLADGLLTEELERPTAALVAERLGRLGTAGGPFPASRTEA
ncbi:ABC transporter ATP-binding protein [Kitasatospora hibisci]|uniref:ABC transporter ATP-binding protein n=1 Tax=Kitasatospora hibisci TaxID=3369522 RepID=UPI0037546A77